MMNNYQGQEDYDNYKIMLIKIDKIIIKDRIRSDMNNLEDLKESISTLGLLHAIGISNEDNSLIYGRRRLEAIRQLGFKEIPARLCSYDNLKTELAEHEENLRRENLSWHLEIKSRSRVYEIYESLGRVFNHGGDRKISIADDRLLTQKEIAKKMGVSVTQLKDDLQLNEAIEKNSDLIKHKQKSKAMKTLRKEIKQKELLKLSDILPKNIQVIHGEFQEIGKTLSNNSIELIFTDPPYGEKNIDIYDDLSEFGKRVLVDNGSLITFCNEGQIDEAINRLGKHLKFWAILSIEMKGPYARIWKQGIVIKAKHLLWFIKGEKRLFPKQIIDNLIQSSTPDKTYHDWTQSTKEGEFIIKCLTSINGTVCDPFLGSGSFGISTKKVGRNFIGIEKDKTYLERAKRLIANSGEIHNDE